MSTPEITSDSGRHSLAKASRARPKAPPASSGGGKKGRNSRARPIEQLAALVAGRRMDRREEGEPGSKAAWLISSLFNLPIIIAVICILILKVTEGSEDKGRSIIIPQSFEDPSLSEHPGGVPHPGANDPMRDAMQNLQQIMKNEGWQARADTVRNVSELLGGQSSDAAVEGIFRGAGGSMGDSGEKDSGVKVFGAAGGGAGVGPKSSFYGTGGNAERIVYILDHSGSMIDNYDSLKRETRRSINNLVPLQWVGIVMFADRAEVLPPATLVRAIPESKKLLLTAMDKSVAEGPNDEKLAPFLSAFQRAFEMKPQLIYFLTDGRFDQDLIKEVAKLNSDKAVSINTVAFVTEDTGYKDLLQKLAKDNNGVYKFVAERELGR